MRPLVLIREALATTWANKVPTTLVAFLVTVMCATTLATVGRTAAAEQQVDQRLDAAGSRVLIVADTSGNQLLPEAVIDQAAGLSTTERAIGEVIPVDVVNGVVGPGGTKAPAWQIVGDPAAVAILTAGRWPGPGEALVSTEALTTLGMDDPTGWVAGSTTQDARDYSVVGSFTPREPFTDYATGILIAAPEGTVSDSLHVVVTDSGLAQTAQDTVVALIKPQRFEDVTITSPVTLAELQDQVAGDLDSFGRTLLLGVLAAGALLVAIVVLSDVLVRRKDLGRRRALGATRGIILALVITRTLVPALLGAALGVGIGLALAGQYDAIPPGQFTVGTATLAVLAALTSAVPPALYAATRDPVRVLRTP